MNDHDDMSARLARGLQEEAERVRPESGLQSILARTRPAPARRPRSHWWPVVGGALATGGLVAAFAFVAVDDDPTVEPPVATATSAVTLYFTNLDGKLVSGLAEVPDTGDHGLDAVNALLAATPEDPDYFNTWRSLSADNDSGLELSSPVTVSSVEPVGNLITVDFDGPVDNPWPLTQIDWAIDPETFSQQLVWTVQNALDSDARVLVTMNGEAVDSILTAEVRQPIAEDPYALAPVQIESPNQGDTVSSPATVSGQSATFEANVVWRVKQNGQVVTDGFTTSEGANGVFGPFEFTVNLPPGDYTVEAFEHNMENGKVINLDSKDFTVQ